MNAPVVVIGAGCIGTAIAYHLAKRGVKGVVVLEREPFAGAGSTSKAAGGIRAQFSTPLSVQLSMRSIDHFERFADEMGTDPVFFQVGYLFLLADEVRWQAFQAQARMQRDLGLPVEVLTPEAVQARIPELRIDDLLGATFCPRDGLGNPHEVTQAYVARARDLGARFEFGRAATGLRMKGERVVGVETAAGAIETPWVVNAAGPYAAEIARWAGLELPVLPVRRHCFTTEPLPFVRDDLPMIVDMKSGVYMHRESGGLLLGLANRDEPPGFDVSVNWDFLPEVVEHAIHRVPALEAAEVSNGWAGLYETTPDHNAILGAPVGLEGLLLANGFSGHGFMQAPATGQLLAEWIVDGRPSLDLHALRLERFAEHQAFVETNVI
ncbi:MAG: FAD-binding oxidoreductase [Candidatus Eisenbacteria bacterium]|uniref:FAD-binding oxidoreductase n=1 Tax=Eiseniibacteriota bacterium TaxID=2212470 RepID=A0A849SGB2_UNCEI|nr:FAD-binding oxidoreductase [Candidatus Eisenbacteria bacterium]